MSISNPVIFLKSPLSFLRLFFILPAICKYKIHGIYTILSQVVLGLSLVFLWSLDYTVSAYVFELLLIPIPDMKSIYFKRIAVRLLDVIFFFL